MSKVISFSISSSYLESLLSLYPELSKNLAAKQFLIDRLDADRPILDDKLGETAVDNVETGNQEKDESVNSVESADTIETDSEDAIKTVGKNETTEMVETPKNHTEITKVLGIKPGNLSSWVKKRLISKNYLNKCDFSPDKKRIVWKG